MAIHPEGNFDAVILDHGFSNTQTGTQQFWVKFKTDEGEIHGFLFLSEAAAPHTIAKIRAMGFQGDDLHHLSDGWALQKHLCNIVVQHDEYKGKVKANVAFVNAYGASRSPQRDPGVAESARRFNALLREEPIIQHTLQSDEPEHERNPACNEQTQITDDHEEPEHCKNPPDYQPPLDDDDYPF
ncbi:MAG: hypothetical protein GY923_15320 [Aestuariibacter sp.]|nr:hypothetical protein [Aestuariibacter sp.]